MNMVFIGGNYTVVTALDPYATSQVASFKGLYAAADKTPERVAGVTLSVP